MSRRFFCIVFLTVLGVCGQGAADTDDELLRSINFATPQSGMYVSPGVNVIFGTAPNPWSGTLHQLPGGTISGGTTITFSNGTLHNSQGTQGIHGGFSTAGEVVMTGDDRFDAREGVVPYSFNVSGGNNRIEGIGTLAHPITLQDSSSSVTLALQSTLAGDIVLGSGGVWLDSTLQFADGRMFLGTGTVHLSNNRLELGGRSLSWGGSVVWDSASDIVLHNDVALNGRWTFSGDATIVGNGASIDVSGGGKIWVKAGATVRIFNTRIRGIKSGSLVFEDQASQFRISGVDLSLDESVSITNGGVYVVGESTFIVGGSTLTFDQKASLTVDHVTLWEDILDGGAGQISFGTTTTNHKALLNNGVIRSVTSSGGSGGSGVELPEANGTVSYSNKQLTNFTVHPTATLDATISNGTVVTQADQDTTVKSGDQLCIQGRNNEFKVRKKLTVDGNVLLDGTSAELKFTFDEKFSNPKVVFNSALNVSKGGRIAFSGRGDVELSDGEVISLNDEGSGENTELVLENGSRLFLQSSASACIDGKGNISLVRGGEINVQNNQHLTIGNSSSDAINIVCDDASVVRVSGQGARLSFHHATYNLSFRRAGVFHIGDGGLAEFNARSGVATGGILSSMTFASGGILDIDSGGTMMFASNTGNAAATSWNNLQGRARVSGGIAYFSESDFDGVMPDRSFSKSGVTILSLVSELLQRSSLQSPPVTLRDAVLFVDSSGVRKVRLKNSIIATLKDDDILTFEHPSTGEVFGTNTGNNRGFRITQSGRRIER